MVRLNLEVKLAYTVSDPGADFFFHIHASRTPQQVVTHERLVVSQPEASWDIQEQCDVDQRCLRIGARPGPLTVSYAAKVEIFHHMAEPGTIQGTTVSQLPLDALPYIYPSRYCQSDRLLNFARRTFGHLTPDYRRAEAICHWVTEYVEFKSNSSDGSTSAMETLVTKVGVCRDFAHLMIALCRALNMPARFVTGADYGAPAEMGPPDFHAYVEVYFQGRWYLFDPSGVTIPMGLIRIATGRDAADTAFATIFGSVTSKQPWIKISAELNPEQGVFMPMETPDALSTCAAS